MSEKSESLCENPAARSSRTRGFRFPLPSRVDKTGKPMSGIGEKTPRMEGPPRLKIYLICRAGGGGKPWPTRFAPHMQMLVGSKAKLRG
jgi:hypothetical protein